MKSERNVSISAHGSFYVSLSVNSYIYIYIYVCVYICVCLKKS